MGDGQRVRKSATVVVRLLLQAGADPNAKAAVGAETSAYYRDITVIGETPLHRADAYGDGDMIRALLDAGADPSIKDGHGESALTWFSRHQRGVDHVKVERGVGKLLAYGEWVESGLERTPVRRAPTHAQRPGSDAAGGNSPAVSRPFTCPRISSATSWLVRPVEHTRMLTTSHSPSTGLEQADPIGATPSQQVASPTPLLYNGPRVPHPPRRPAGL